MRSCTTSSAAVGGPPGKFGCRLLSAPVNFFGHATVAVRICPDPRFVLGSMLPDLLSMAGIRLTAVDDAEVARGIALHHETDRVFHDLPSFRAACGSALLALEPDGVARGAARAVGHVGSELLLDGLLSGNRAARQCYAAALRVGVSERIEQRFAFREGGEPAHLREVLLRLQHAPLPEGYVDPEFVCDRLQVILSRRPRLALQPGDRAKVLRWLDRARDHLEQDCDLILAALPGAERESGPAAAE